MGYGDFFQKNALFFKSLTLNGSAIFDSGEALVAGWMNDEVVNQHMLVLIGKQGIYKTTWLEQKRITGGTRCYVVIENQRSMVADEALISDPRQENADNADNTF